MFNKLEKILPEDYSNFMNLNTVLMCFCITGFLIFKKLFDIVGEDNLIQLILLIVTAAIFTVLIFGFFCRLIHKEKKKIIKTRRSRFERVLKAHNDEFFNPKGLEIIYEEEYFELSEKTDIEENLCSLTSAPENSEMRDETQALLI